MGAQPQLYGPAYEWALWSTTMRVVTADPHALPSARRLVDAELARVELAASRERRDAEVAHLPTGRRVHISGTLTAILTAALRAAHDTAGALDPTVSRPLRPVDDDAERWRGIGLDEQARTVFLPCGVELDLGPVARAWAADRCAAVVAEILDVGVLVSLGGDIATAGPVGSGAWEILVQDLPDDPGALVAIPTGLAVVTSTSATSSTYRAATVVAADCVSATTWSVAALAETGPGVVGLQSRGLPARLVTPEGTVRHMGGWPDDAEMVTTRADVEP